jgi:hypothetical protein
VVTGGQFVVNSVVGIIVGPSTDCLVGNRDSVGRADESGLGTGDMVGPTSDELGIALVLLSVVGPGLTVSCSRVGDGVPFKLLGTCDVGVGCGDGSRTPLGEVSIGGGLASGGGIILGPIEVGKAAGALSIVGLGVVVGVSVEGSWDGWSSENAGGKSSLGAPDGWSSEIAGCRSAWNVT